MRNWGQMECRPALRDSCSFVNVEQPPFNSDPPRCLVQVDLCDAVCFCGCVCGHEFATSPPIKQWMLIALHSPYLSTCLLVLVISLAPTVWSSTWLLSSVNGEVLWVGKTRGVIKKKETRGWGNKELRKWEDGSRRREIPRWVQPSILRITATSISTSAAEGSVPVVHTSAFQNEIFNTGKKTDAFIRWLQYVFLVLLRHVFGVFFFLWKG